MIAMPPPTKPIPGDRAQLQLGEAELRPPVAEDGAADGKAETGGNQRQETGDKERTVVVHAEVYPGVGGKG